MIKYDNNLLDSVRPAPHLPPRCLLRFSCISLNLHFNLILSPSLSLSLSLSNRYGMISLFWAGRKSCHWWFGICSYYYLLLHNARDQGSRLGRRNPLFVDYTLDSTIRILFQHQSVCKFRWFLSIVTIRPIEDISFHLILLHLLKVLNLLLMSFFLSFFLSLSLSFLLRNLCRFKGLS